MTYKQRMAQLADYYWQARSKGFDKMAKAIYAAMDDVPADKLPPGVRPELVSLADQLALNERERSNDAGVPWICRGHWPFDAYTLDLVGDGWVEIEAYERAYNRVWHNDTLHATLTYTEGDLALCIYWPAEAYALGIADDADFYRRMSA